MMALQNLFQLNGSEKEQAAEQLREFLHSTAIDDAPFNVIGAAMFASLSRKAASGQKRPPSQGTANDVEIVSTLLPYCDAMFLDNECRALLSDIPKSHSLKYPCRVFSPNTSADFIRYLTDVRDSASSEHMRLIEQIYGPDPLKIPTRIHGVGPKARSAPS
jgi:hypothetical protein